MTVTDATIPAYYRTPEWNRLRAIVLERDNGICFYCGEQASTADHVIPRSASGMDDPENLVACCLICNDIARGRRFSDREVKKRWIANERKRRTRRIKSQPGFDRQHYLATMRALRRIQHSVS